VSVPVGRIGKVAFKKKVEEGRGGGGCSSSRRFLPQH